MHLPVGRSVIASPAAKAATCQLLGHSGSRQACVVSTYIIRRGRGLRRLVVRSGDAAHRPAARPRLTPFPAAEWIVVWASPSLRKDGFAIGDSNPNTNEGYDGGTFRGTRAHGPGTRAESNQLRARRRPAAKGIEGCTALPGCPCLAPVPGRHRRKWHRGRAA